MRIGFDTTSLSVTQSGVGVYTANLLTHLRQQIGSADSITEMCHISVSAASAQSGARKVQKRLNKTLWMQAVLPWQLIRHPLDVCHFTNSVAPLWSPCSTVITIHDMTLWLYPEYHYCKRLLAMRPFIPIAARRAAAIIAVSESVKADIVRILRIPANKVHVVYSASSEPFRRLFQGASDEQEAAAFRQHYGLPEHFILSVGTLEPRKNLVRLLEAFALLRQDTSMPQCLVIVGTRGWKDEPIFAAIERLGLQQSVRYLGYLPTDALIRLYNLASVLAFPSLYEGCGLPVLEAMACGTPVVTSYRGGLSEIAGDAAEYVEPLSVESIAEGLRCILSDPAYRAELVSKGYHRAAQFNWQTTAAHTYRVYGSFLGRG